MKNTLQSSNQPSLYLETHFEISALWIFLLQRQNDLIKDMPMPYQKYDFIFFPKVTLA